MATIPSSPTWSNDVYQIDTMDAVLGGQDGVINVQAKQLADRTVYLKQEVEAAGAVADGADTKADSALAQISGIEAAAGSAQANAAEALTHKQGALAAQALAEQAQASAEADAAAAAAAATGAAADRVLAGQRAAEAGASAATALAASSMAVAASNEVGTIGDAKKADIIAASSAGLSSIQDATNNSLAALETSSGAKNAELASIRDDSLAQMIPARDATIAASQTATEKAGEASASATTATTQAEISTAQAGLAMSAKAAAEAARDAAILNSTMYPDEATGRAAVANGAYFKVIGTGDIACTEYRRTDASTSVRVATYPSISFTKTGVFDRLFTRNGYFTPDNLFTSDATWGTTEYLPVDILSIGSISLYGHTSVASIVFFDAQKRPISNVVSPAIGTPVTIYPAIPAGAVYVTFTCFRTFLSTQSFNFSVLPSKTANKDTLDSVLLGNLWVNLSSQFNVTGYINASTGALEVDANWLSSGFIAVSAGSTLDVRLIGHTALNSVSFYNSSKTYISGLKVTVNNKPFTQIVVCPANTAYVRFSGANPATYAAAAGTTPFMALAKNVSNDLVSAEAAIQDQITNNSVSNYGMEFAPEATSAGWIGLTGLDVGTDPTWLRSPRIAVVPGEVVICNMVGHPALNSVSFYDSTNAFLIGYAASSNVLPGAIFNQSVTAPANAAYFRLSFGNPATYNVAIASGITPSAKIFRNLAEASSDAQASAAAAQAGLSYRPKFNFTSMRKLVLTGASKVILYGDSISSTDYPWYQSSMAALTGATVYNGGYSGQNAAMTAANAKLQRIWDYQPNLIVVLLGGNDNGASQSVGSFSGYVEGEPIVPETDIGADYRGTYFIQAVSHTMRKIKEYYYNIRARANLTGTETEAEKTAKIDAVLKPVLVFCSSLPQKRNNSSDAFSQPANWERKRAAIAECCQKYGVHFVDLQSKLNWDMTQEPYWPGSTNKTTNFGVYTMDGLHPNKYGYQQMSEIICAELGL